MNILHEYYIPVDNLLSNGLDLKRILLLRSISYTLLTGYQLTKPYKYLYKLIDIYMIIIYMKNVLIYCCYRCFLCFLEHLCGRVTEHF